MKATDEYNHREKPKSEKSLQSLHSVKKWVRVSFKSYRNCITWGCGVGLEAKSNMIKVISIDRSAMQ